MSRPFSHVNRFVKVWNDYHLREWILAITGAVVFIAGSIVGTIALRSSTLPWAIFDFVVGIAGLIMFFISTFELFFKMTSSVMLSFQEKLAQQVAMTSYEKSTVDVGTMTTSPKESLRNPMNFLSKEDRKMMMNFPPKESRKMPMTFPGIDRSKSLACDRHPKMKYRTLLSIQEKSDLEILETEKFQCPASVDASQGNSKEEPLYYDFDDSYNTESLTVKDSSTNKLPKDGTLDLKEYLASGLRYHYETHNFLRCVKTLNLSPGKYSVASKFQSLSSKLMRRKMITSSPEWEMPMLASGEKLQGNFPSSSTSEDNANLDVGQSFLATSSDIAPAILPRLSSNKDIQTDIKSTSQASTIISSTGFTKQSRSPNHLQQSSLVSVKNQQPLPRYMGKMYESLPDAKSSKCNEVYLTNSSKSSDPSKQDSTEPNRESDILISSSDQLPLSTNLNYDTNSNRNLFSRSKRKSLHNLSQSTQHPLESFEAEPVKRFY